ncbi:uncharacterized protein LOC110271975 isoform X3 [Arachis ipaensis]|uniref:uncharacterized protein LOC110271975 isoform X3 n=1 Tax=Arachis ipaensis TaxID=130454 RepID=UPI000A2B0745|nr:uncharacterized protein LOC110271975 isoform X3 [Arachis ipaensis]
MDQHAGAVSRDVFRTGDVIPPFALPYTPPPSPKLHNRNGSPDYQANTLGCPIYCASTASRTSQIMRADILSLVAARSESIMPGVMTITNTNFKTKILVNADLEVVKKFCQKLIGLGHKQTTNLKVIGCVVRPFPFEDFHVYTICINFSYQGYHQGSVFKCVSLMIQIQQLLCCLKMLPLSSSVSLPLTSAAKRSLRWMPCIFFS